MLATNPPCWKFLSLSDIEILEFCNAYKGILSDITNNAFGGMLQLPSEELIETLKQSSHVALLTNGHPVIGFAFFNIYPERPLHGKPVVWLNKIAITREFQSQGIGLRQLIPQFGKICNMTPGYIGCCTQNPSVINFMSTLGKKVFPFNCNYGTLEGLAAWTYINTQVHQVQAKFRSFGGELDRLLDSDFGLLHSGYGEKINASNKPLHESVARALAKRNFCEENGDLLVILAQLN